MTSSVSRRMMDRVEAVLPTEGGLTPPEVVDMFPQFAQSSVRGALYALVDEGRAVRDSVNANNTKYRKPTGGEHE